jgi:rhamnose transport system substrate-binding protein
MRGISLCSILVASLVPSTTLGTTSNDPSADENSEVLNVLRYSDIVMIPKYKQYNHEEMVLGARIAHGERGNMQVPTFDSWSPRRATSSEDQIRVVQDATELRVQAIMLSNNAGETIENYTKAASESGSFVVTYDSPFKGGKDAGESFHVAPVDFAKTGELMAEMALSILGDGSGDFVLLASSPEATNQATWISALKQVIKNDANYSNIRLVANEIYYPDEDSKTGYMNRTLEIAQLKLNGTYPELGLIMVPSTSGAAGAAAALVENGLCDQIKVSGLGSPPELLKASIAGCAPQFALFDNFDLGYLAYHATHELVTGGVEGKNGENVRAGRLGTRQIEADPYRENALWIKLGDFIKYDQSNVVRASFLDCMRGNCGGEEDEKYFQREFIEKYKSKALAIIPKVTGTISFSCSLFLASYILCSVKRRSSVFGRIMVGLSIADMFSSAMWFLSTWPMPANSSWLHWGAAGTTQSCSTQGFFLQLGLCTATFYQMTLLMYYFLTIVREWRESQIKKLEIFFHLVSCSVGLATSIAGLALKMYNPVSRGSVCW